MTSPNTDTRHWTWRVEAGEREAIDIPILQSDDVTPQDLTGYTIDAKIKTRPGGTVLYTFPLSQVIVEDNIITLVIPAPVSATWTWSVGWWRLKVTAPDPDPADPETDRVIQGAFIVDPD